MKKSKPVFARATFSRREKAEDCPFGHTPEACQEISPE
jgi:hypothetical protein